MHSTPFCVLRREHSRARARVYVFVPSCRLFISTNMDRRMNGWEMDTWCVFTVHCTVVSQPPPPPPKARMMTMTTTTIRMQTTTRSFTLFALLFILFCVFRRLFSRRHLSVSRSQLHASFSCVCMKWAFRIDIYHSPSLFVPRSTRLT